MSASALPRPYYDHGGITIYHANCWEILPLLGHFDLLLADPPWGIGIDSSNASRGRTRSGRWKMPRANRGLCAVDHPPVIGDDRPFDPRPLLELAPRIILWGANNYASRLPDSPCWLTWDRQSSGDVTDCELAWVGGHRFKTVRIFRHLWCGVARDSENAGRSLHPTQKPVALMSWCLGFFPEARSVLDPFMGSGPVAKACKDHGLRYVGIELVEEYCAIAVRRLAQEVLFS
jgi:hypothetical protein